MPNSFPHLPVGMVPFSPNRSENKGTPDKEARILGEVAHGVDARLSTMAIQGEIQERRVRGVMGWIRRNPVDRGR